MRDEIFLKHDPRTREDLKIKNLLFRLSPDPCGDYGRFWWLVEILHFERDHSIELTDDVIDTLAAEWRCLRDEVIGFFDNLEKAKITQTTQGKIFFPRQIRDFSERLQDRERRAARSRENGAKGGRPRKDLESEETHENPDPNPETLEERREEKRRININTPPVSARARGFNFSDSDPEPGTGRLSLEDFPAIRLTPAELDRVFARFTAMGLPQEFWETVFSDADAYLQLRPRLSAEARLTGFSLTNALDQAGKARRLERTTTDGATPRKAQTVLNAEGTIAAVEAIMRREGEIQ